MDNWQRHGLKFRYPDSWELSEEGDDEQWSVTLQSPGTAFWSLMLLRQRPEPDDVLDSAIEAFRDEYDEFDAHDVEATLCGRGCAATDVDFVCLELVNQASIRSTQLDDMTVVVLWQVTDHELEDVQQVMEAITASLQEADANAGTPAG